MAANAAEPTEPKTPLPRGWRGVLAWLEYLGFRVVVAVARALPVDTASAVSGRIWRMLAPRLRRHRRARANIAASLPELSEEEREAILIRMWEGLGRTFAEGLHLPEFAAETQRFTLDLPEEVREVIGRGGVIMASLHMGNWEVAATGVSRLGPPVAGVYQSLKNPLVDAYVTGMRAPIYPAGLFRKGHDTVFRLMRVLRTGQVIAVMADLREHRGIPVPFFGRPAPSNHFPALLARSQNVPLLAGRVIRTQGAHFVMKAEIVPVPRTNDREADVAAATAALQALFERYVRENPDQWMWGHRRWG